MAKRKQESDPLPDDVPAAVVKEAETAGGPESDGPMGVYRISGPDGVLIEIVACGCKDAVSRAVDCGLLAAECAAASVAEPFPR